MRTLRWLLPLLAVVLIPAAALAQGGTIRGTVQDAATSRPIPSAQIQVVGTTLGTVADAQGNFQVSVPAGTHTLRASAPGFAAGQASVTVAAGQTANTTLRLTASAIALEELIVTGVVGPTVKAKVPFEVSTVKAENMPVIAMSAGGAIAGKVAGARVVQASGSPGSSPSILLRGPTSINSSGRSQEPLYIVDGVILAGGLGAIDAQDIESVEVVKGAAAASLYGSRAGAGVIQITTKRGTANLNRTRYTLRSEYGVNSIEGSINLSKYHYYKLNSGGTKFMCTGSKQPGEFECDWQEAQYSLVPNRDSRIPASVGQEFATFATNPYPGTNYDQVHRIFDPGNYLQNYVGIEGASGNTNFYASFGNLDQSGVVRGDNGYQRQNFRLNVDNGRGTPLQVSANAFYSIGHRTPISGRAVFQSLTHMLPNVDLLARDEKGEYLIQPNPRDTEYQNPLYDVEARDWTENTQRITGGVLARYQPRDWFNVEGNVSYDRTDWNSRNYVKRGFKTILKSTANEGTLSLQNYRDDALNSSLTGTLYGSFGDLSTRTQLRYLYEQGTYRYQSAYDERFPVDAVPRVGIGMGNKSVSSEETDIRSEGFFAITNFDFKDRYILDALIRRDGSSLFGADQRWQTYFRLSGAYRMSQEPWWNLSAIDEFKLRYSYGTAGGRPGFYAQYETYSVGAGGSVSPVNLGNRDLRPEYVTEQEAGLDMRLFRRATFGLTYAHAVADDQILPVPLPAYAGFGTMWMNAGTLESRTWEATLDAPILQRGGFNWSSRLLFDRTRQKVTKLDVPCYRATGFSDQGIETAFLTCENETLGTFYGVKFARNMNDLPEGVDRSQFQVNDDGYVVWVGAGNQYTDGLAKGLWGSTSAIANPVTNGKYNWGMPIVVQGIDPRTGAKTTVLPLGNTMPKFNLSWSHNIDWNGLSLYGLLDGSFGFNIYNQTRQWSLFNDRGGALDQADKSDELKKPVAYYKTAGLYNALGPNSHFVEDGSFVKLREVALRYNIGRSKLSNLPVGGMDRVTLGLIGRNLQTWTKYSGYDPEVGVSGGRTGSAVINRFDRYGYPNFRTITAQVEIGF